MNSILQHILVVFLVYCLTRWSIFIMNNALSVKTISSIFTSLQLICAFFSFGEDRVFHCEKWALDLGSWFVSENGLNCTVINAQFSDNSCMMTRRSFRTAACTFVIFLLVLLVAGLLEHASLLTFFSRPLEHFFFSRPFEPLVHSCLAHSLLSIHFLQICVGLYTGSIMLLAKSDADSLLNFLAMVTDGSSVVWWDEHTLHICYKQWKWARTL